MTLLETLSARTDRLNGLRMLSTEKAVALAERHGAKLHRHKPRDLVVPKCPWVVLDQPDKPRLWWGFFPTARDAAIMFCMEHEIDAPVPSAERSRHG